MDNNNDINNDDSYNRYNNTDLNETQDDLYEERRNLKQQQEDMNKTNLFKIRIIESEINSNLTLQIILYFNIFFYIECLILEIACLVYRFVIYKTKDDEFIVFRLVLFVAWVFSEPLRINFGYQANVSESFYYLILFIILSAITIVLHILTYWTKKPFPMEIACTTVFIFFVLIEFVFSVILCCGISDLQTALYYLRNSQTYIISNKEKIKTSDEIEEELYIKFPKLRKSINYNNNKKNN